MSIFEKPSLVSRIAIGKGTGFVIGLLGFVMLPYFLPDAGLLVRWGILLWYTTLGGIIGMIGVMTWHPILRMPMPWWFSAPLFGAWMNFVLVFFVYDTMAAMMVTIFGPDGYMVSPFWFALEGALVGLFIGYFATKYGGEGSESLVGQK